MGRALHRLAPSVVLLVLLAACGADGAADERVADEAGVATEAASNPTPASPSPTAATPPAEPTATPTPTPEPAPPLEIVATVAPIADLVRHVAGPRAEVRALVPPGADSHTYEPRPGDVALLGDADAFVGVGLDLNAQAVRLASDNLSEGAPLLLLGEDLLEHEALLEDGHSHDHDHDHSHDHNPHVWTSVRHSMAMVEGIADLLAELDPDEADAHRRRADAYLEELEALDDAIADAVATVPEAQRTLVTYHDAWAYFARDYGFRSVTAVQPSDFSEPSAAEVRAIIDLIREQDVPALFGSEVFPSDVLDAIAAETGAEYVADLSDDTLPGEPGSEGHSFVALMARNAERIVEALGGDAGALAAFVD